MPKNETRAVFPRDDERIAVRVDGEWLTEVRPYTEDLPVFTGEDGTEVDVRSDGTILYETPDGAVQEMDPYVDEGGVASYLPMRVYPADEIEVHDLEESEADPKP